MDKINSDNFVEMNAYTLEHRILVTGNTKANWELFYHRRPSKTVITEKILYGLMVKKILPSHRNVPDKI